MLSRSLYHSLPLGKNFASNFSPQRLGQVVLVQSCRQPSSLSSAFSPPQARAVAGMATASKVSLSLSHPGIYHTQTVTEDAAKTASTCLLDNHTNHHIFYNPSGFHNHIAHHLLTLYALGANSSQIQSHYDRTKQIQRPPFPLEDNVVQDMHSHFSKYLGNEKYYHDWLVFFQGELDRLGVDAVLQEYVLKGDARADNMLVRLHAGFLHPIIHLGFGIEFAQPAIVAEALAEAAVHDDWIGPFFIESERAAASVSGNGKSLVQLLDEIRADEKLSTAAHWEDGNKIRDGIMKRAPVEMVKYASQWKVGAGDIEEKMAEMVNASVYYTGSAQHPPKRVMFDFYFMHCVNCSIFYPSLLALPSLTTQQKCRLLEWKGRLDLCMYASRRSPKPLVEEIVNYIPKAEWDETTKAKGSGWDGIIARVVAHSDDGHAGKLVRALAHGERVSAPYAGSDRFRIKPDMWLKLGHMAIDSVERGEWRKGDAGITWLRSAGFEEAWEPIEDRSKAQL